MKAYQVSEYGPNASFKVAEIERPEPRPGSVLIEVAATSLNPVDHKIMRNVRGINPDLPATLHMDVAGTVVEVGPGVTEFTVGDHVYGCAGGVKGPAGNFPGALADFMEASVDLIAKKPTSLDFPEAASLPLVSITAWEGLFQRAHVGLADNALIHAGAGGVGHVALQLAKIAGATVTTTVSTEAKAEIARTLGADQIVFYKQESVDDYVKRLTNGDGFDVVYDTIGGANLDASLQAAKVSGHVVSIIGQNTHDLTPMHAKGLSLHLVFMILPLLTGKGRPAQGEILRRVAHLVDEGKLRPLLHDRRFSFSEANDAHALFASGGHTGKIVLIHD